LRRLRREAPNIPFGGTPIDYPSGEFGKPDFVLFSSFRVVRGENFVAAHKFSHLK
jgi:hypothetical protein